MKKNIIIFFALISLSFGLVTFLFPFVLSVETVNILVHEDSIIEYLGAAFFFLGGIFFLVAFFTSRTGNQFLSIRTRRNFFYLFLSLVLIFGAGEEISWGQRLLGFSTPESIEEVNIQDEFTIHNLPAFDPTNSDSLLNMNRMFIYFWFSFGVIVPIGALLINPFQKFCERLGFPIVPIWLGVQFVLFYVMSKLYEPLGAVREVYEGRIVEFRETQHALIFFLIGLYFFLKEKE